MSPDHSASHKMTDPSAPVSVTLEDGTVLQECRPDWWNIGDLIGRGWSLIPLKPRSKLPAVRWTDYQSRLATLDELEAWFTPAGYNIGVVTGIVSKLFVIDVDSPEALEWAQRNLPPCDLRVRSGEGMHLYFPYSGTRPLRNKTRVHVAGRTLELDVRAEGGYIVGPGSTHPNGHIYTREGVGWR